MSISILNIVKTTLIDIFTNSGSGSDEWKVLLLDDHGMNLVAPLFKVHDLRTQNITVHFHLRQKRDCIPDNVAIYVILPTEENINIILKDIEIDQYKLFYLYFVGRCPLSLLETFSKRVSCIQFDENRIHVSETLLNFLPQSDFFFTSRLAPSLHALHGSDRLVKNSLTEALAESLYHVIQNLNVHPIIVTPTTGICRSVFENLKDRCMHMDRIRDSKQPTLLLLDRMSDLATSLSFPFSYGGLIGDLMDFNLNKLRLTTSHEEKTFELSNGDEFWSQNASEDFSIVCTKVNDLITNFQREKESFQSLTGSNEFCSVLDRVSDLSTRKKIADIHAVVCHELLSIIRSRELDTYHAVSRELSTGANQSITQLLVDCVTKPTMGSDSDRLRILLQAIFSMPNFKSDLKNMTTILPNLTQRDPLLINSVVEWAITLSTSHIAKDLSKSADWFGQKLMSISRTINSSHEETYYSPFVRIVEMLSEMNPSSSKSENRQQFLQNVIAWDTRKNALCNIGSVDYCIIYVVGGITFSENFELKAWCELPRNERKTILVGSTDVQNGATFLSQIMALSTEKS